MTIGALRIPPRVLDWLLALVPFTVYVVSFATNGSQGPAVVHLLLVALMTVPLASRRSHPLIVTVVVVGAVMPLAAWLTDPYVGVSPLIPMLLAAYAAGAHARGPASVAAGVFAALGGVGIALVVGSTVWGDYLFPTVIVWFGWLGGWLVRTRTELAAELHEEAVRAEEARERHAAEAVAEERRRIARELHDVVAHSLSVMVVQAGGARRIGERDPARAKQAAERIERTGREALTEMRRLLGVLHVDPLRTPQPGMEQVRLLVDRARDAGLPVELEVVGGPRELPAGVDLTGYRIVQEALTNTMKHAGAAPTSVRVRYCADALELEVADRGPEVVSVAGAGADGHGLVGMRERVRVVGGELHAGPRAGGGFDVRARLPLRTVA